MTNIAKRIILGLIWAIAFFTAMFVFKDLFVDPLVQQLSRNKTLELIAFIAFTIIALLTGKHVPWILEEES